MDEIVLEAKSKFEKCIENLKQNYNTLRTGRANPSLLDRVECDYYGDKMPIKDICMISVPEPRQLLVKPYDKGDVKSVTAAIAAANLGINPQVDGDQIRLIMPPTTEETRKGLVKRAKEFTEECKVAVRNIRRDYMDLIHDDDAMSEDYQKRVEKEFQDCVDEIVKKIDAAMSEKEKEIMSV